MSLSKSIRIDLSRYDESISIENTPMFDLVLNHFCKKREIDISKEELLSDQLLLREFEDFFIWLALTWKISIKQSDLNILLLLISNLRNKVWYTVRWVESLYDNIVKIIFVNNWQNKQDESVKRAMLWFIQAYYIMKNHFNWKYREVKNSNWENERYFEHLKSVAYILLEELSSPTLEKIILWLLHDSIEDIPNLTFEILKWLFWEKIANATNKLSKKDWRNYLNEEEINHIESCEKKCIFDEEYKTIKSNAKELRNLDYFWHMDQLEDWILDVKFADRIHNLRTLKWCERWKIIRKIEETKKYFIDLAKKRNYKAFEILENEIKKLEEYLNK